MKKTIRNSIVWILTLTTLCGFAHASDQMMIDGQERQARIAKLIGKNKIIPQEKRSEVISIWMEMVRKYPKEAKVHQSMGWLYASALQGDDMVKSMKRACQLDSSICKEYENYKKSLVGEFIKCMGNGKASACEMTSTSSKTLTKLLAGKKLTNKGVTQKWIGKIIKFKGMSVKVKITFVSGQVDDEIAIWKNGKLISVTKKIIKGKTYSYLVDSVKSLDKVSLEATIKGY